MRTFRSFSRSKGMGAIFQKKSNKMLKRDKYLKIWANMYKIWKYFEKSVVIAYSIICKCKCKRVLGMFYIWDRMNAL